MSPLNRKHITNTSNLLQSATYDIHISQFPHLVTQFHNGNPCHPISELFSPKWKPLSSNVKPLSPNFGTLLSKIETPVTQCQTLVTPFRNPSLQNGNQGRRRRTGTKKDLEREQAAGEREQGRRRRSRERESKRRPRLPPPPASPWGRPSTHHTTAEE